MGFLQNCGIDVENIIMGYVDELNIIDKKINKRLKLQIKIKKKNMKKLKQVIKKRTKYITYEKTPTNNDIIITNEMDRKYKKGTKTRLYDNKNIFGDVYEVIQEYTWYLRYRYI